MLFPMRLRKVSVLFMLLLVILPGCAWGEVVAPFSDVRWPEGGPFVPGNVLKEGTYRPEDIHTFWFNDRVVFEGAENVAAALIEAGKNPGLGVRSLHARGITGKGVRVAIIDQPLPGTHSEYKEKIVAYYNTSGTLSPMHGPAVASLLAGTECGTAPDAKLYFAGAASWTRDSAYYADALFWVIAQNNALPEGDKIRVVSVSAAPSGPGSPFDQNTEQWDMAVTAAKAAGILVLDCRMNDETGFIRRGRYEPSAPDDLSRFIPGSPQRDDSSGPFNAHYIYAPASGRTQAEEYDLDENHWQYTGDGGLSWTIPYVAGVLAMGWQVDPTLTNDEILAVLRSTAYVNKAGCHIINPVAFIEAIENPASDPDPQPDPDPIPDPAPPAIEWLGGVIPDPKVGSSTMLVVTTSRPLADAVVTVTRPDGGQGSILARVSGTTFSFSFRAVMAGRYVLNFTMTDLDGYVSTAPLELMVTSDSRPAPVPDQQSGNGSSGCDSGFGLTVLTLVLGTLCGRKRSPRICKMRISNR